MVFPAGILQPPFFIAGGALDRRTTAAIGMVMGHELTHGFDDEGRQFDGDGNLHEWWSPTVGKAFEERAECVAKQYDGYVAVEDVHLNGKLTLGENIADIGGLKMATRRCARGRQGQPPDARRRLHDGAAVLHRLRAGLVHQLPAGGGADCRRRRTRTPPRSGA